MAPKCLLQILFFTGCLSVSTSQLFPGGLNFIPGASTDQQFPPRQNKTPPVRVYPGMLEFPDHDAFYQLVFTLDGDLITPLSGPEYFNATWQHNLRVLAFPYEQIMVESVEDVQRVILFAKKYNLMVSVRSSGHSYIGRSTHDGSIVINLARMKGKRFNLNSMRNQAGEVTLETGNSWLEVYNEVEKQVTYDDVGNPQGRVIIGGSAHTVAMGGYTQGGGHSPMCRQLGLAADNLLEATIVLADGRKAVVNEHGTSLTALDGSTSQSNDTSLFWAIRGGGGGTWGVITDFTFKLHYAPKRFRNIELAWALTYRGADIGSDTIRFVLRQLNKLSRQWGGYMGISGVPLSADAVGGVTLFLNHFGTDDDPSNAEVNELLAHNTYQHQFTKKDLSYSTFIGYENTALDPANVYTYIYNNFIQPSLVEDDTKLDQLVDFFMSLTKPASVNSSHGCTGAMIGGKMREVADGDTPVNPKFRSGLLSLSCGLSWPGDTGRDSFYVGNALLMRDKLAPLGEGSYFNEPAEDLNDWKVQFWGNSSNYDRLLQIKRQWDPDHFFWCHNCVGSDDVTTAHDDNN